MKNLALIFLVITFVDCDPLSFVGFTEVTGQAFSP